MMLSVTMRILEWPKPAMVRPSLPLAPGPTRIVGWGMGRKRTANPAPRIAALSAVVRSDSLRNSDIKIILL